MPLNQSPVGLGNNIFKTGILPVLNVQKVEKLENKSSLNSFLVIPEINSI